MSMTRLCFHIGHKHDQQTSRSQLHDKKVSKDRAHSISQIFKSTIFGPIDCAPPKPKSREIETNRSSRPQNAQQPDFLRNRACSAKSVRKSFQDSDIFGYKAENDVTVQEVVV